MNIIGLGTPGVMVARAFEKYSQYTVYKIDSEDIEEDGYYKIPKFESPENYEEDCPVPIFLEKITGRTLVILSGTSYESSALLKMMQCCHKRCNITILYLQPELEMCNKTKILQEKVIRNVLQEYARSGVFERMIMVTNQNIESVVGPTTIREYYKKLNETVSSAVHMINVLDKSNPIYSTFSKISNAARICTLAVFDICTGEEKSFFPIDNVSEIRYYYYINKNTIDTDTNILSKIKENMNLKEGTKSYAVYESEYENDYGYALYFSKNIQK